MNKMILRLSEKVGPAAFSNFVLASLREKKQISLQEGRFIPVDVVFC